MLLLVKSVRWRYVVEMLVWIAIAWFAADAYG